MQVETHFQVAEMFQQPMAIIDQRLVSGSISYNMSSCEHISIYTLVLQHIFAC